MIMTAFGAIDTAIEAMRARRLALRRQAGPASTSCVLHASARSTSAGCATRTARCACRRARARPRSSARARAMRELYALVERVALSHGAGADPRRERHRQGAGRARDPRRGPRARAAVRRDQLHGAARDAARERAVRSRRAARSPARRRRARGLFVEADGGTLFLDEIGDMAPALQAQAAARARRTARCAPVGCRRAARKVDVRVIAATHQDLEDARAREARSAGSVLPPRRRADPRAAAARAPRGHPAARRALPRAARDAQPARRPSRGVARRGRRGAARATRGPATCASSRT